MRRLLPLILVLSLLGAPRASAQYAARRDSAAVSTLVFRATELIAPGVLMTSGVLIHCFGHDAIDVPVNRWAQEEWRRGRPERNFDNYIQYLPLAMDLGLGLVGARSEHAFVDRTL